MGQFLDEYNQGSLRNEKITLIENTITGEIKIKPRRR
jgi:hypothetical protein